MFIVSHESPSKSMVDFALARTRRFCETYGLDKEGARHHGYRCAVAIRLLAIAAGTGDVLMVARGRANSWPTSSQRYGGARGQLTDI